MHKKSSNATDEQKQYAHIEKYAQKQSTKKIVKNIRMQKKFFKCNQIAIDLNTPDALKT